MSKVILPPPPPPPPSEKKDFRFEIPTKINLGEQEREYIIDDGPGLVEEDSNKFGLTRRDYAFLLCDIENEIARFDGENGFDGIGYHEKDGSYVYAIDKAKSLNEKRRRKFCGMTEGAEF
jgi:hypothetical protein